MALEATVICIDNSEWARNADFSPSRLDAQKDAINILASAKTNLHHENAVGILAMAGDRVDVCVTPTNDMGKIISGLHGVKINSKSDFVRGIQTAQLALKHRINKNQKQRIICFFASPVEASDNLLKQIGRQLKKNNVSLDIVNVGEIESNSDKLYKLYDAVNSSNTSHILECYAVADDLSDKILFSDIMRDHGVQRLNNTDTATAASTANEFGVDPNLDPDLYMALRLSLQEEQAREQREQTAKAAADTNVSGGTTQVTESIENSQAQNNENGTAQIENDASNNTSTNTPLPEQQLLFPCVEGMDAMDDELRQALLMSMQDYAGDSNTHINSGNSGSVSENVNNEEGEGSNAVDSSCLEQKSSEECHESEDDENE